MSDGYVNLPVVGGSGVTSVTASVPLASTGGTTPVISIRIASGSQSGALSSADWTTFNSKQPAGNYALYDLSNLTSPTAINQDLLMDADGTLDIGSPDSGVTYLRPYDVWVLSDVNIATPTNFV